MRLVARSTRPPSLARALVFVLAVLGASCGGRRPDFSIDDARSRLADAFGQEEEYLSVYDDYRSDADDELAWIVEFKLDGYRPFLQARFAAESDRWALAGVRDRASGSDEQPWQPVGVLVGRVRGEVADHAEETHRLIADLAHLVEQYAVDRGNVYPTGVDMSGLRSLLVNGRYTKRWWYDTDGYGNALVFHAAPDGQSYIILSPGSDGQWDMSPSEYFRNTDEGMEAYEGLVSDPTMDVIRATGAFVQSYEP